MILQHRRERFHPFNTARIVQHALERSQLLVAHNVDLASQFSAMQLRNQVGLLYPGNEAEVLTELPADALPDQLIVIDGTWHQAKTLLRDIPRLQSLPRYCLAPSSPGRYRIRREPNDQSLSTLEATVAALRAIEPETPGLDRLTDVFDRMIGDQLKHKSTNWRRNARRQQTKTNRPRMLAGNLDNIVVAYGERERGRKEERGRGRHARALPVYWTAQRLVSGETFRCAIQSESLGDAEFRNRIRLSAGMCDDAVPVPSFRDRWRTFLKPTDRVVVFHQSTANLLKNVDPEFVTSLVLKSVNVDPEWGNTGNQPTQSLPMDESRAAERLANAVRLVEYLHSL